MPSRNIFIFCALLMGTGCLNDTTALQSHSATVTSSDASLNGTDQPQATACTPLPVELYFTPFDDVPSKILDALDQAEDEVVLAHYNIRYQPFLDKLVELRNRGVEIHIAVDASRAAESWNRGDDFLEAHGIAVHLRKPEHRYALMHLKATVIDGEVLMTGSFNWNETAAQFNEENMMLIRDEAAAALYRDEIFGIINETDHHAHLVSLSPCTDVLFAPDEALDDPIVAAIDQATTSIDIAMFVLTERDIGNALVRAQERGVMVRLITEDKMAGYSWIDEALESRGAEVIRAANTRASHSSMHIKFGVIDQTTVITGATNWTHNGTTRSNEDLIITTDAHLVAEHLQFFEDLRWNYRGKDEGAPRAAAPFYFHALASHTQPGDRLVLTGNHPLLGNWSPAHGLELNTSASTFPSWIGRIELPADYSLEFKLVTIRSSGFSEWEPGPNRVHQTSASGRSTVLSTIYGDTSATMMPFEQSSAERIP